MTVQEKKLRVAFLGGAFDSAVGRSHRIAIEMDQCFELVAGCFSRNDKKNRDSAIKYGVNPERAHKNVHDLIAYESSNLDCVIILTPQDQHLEHLKICLEAGIPVICEKALVCTSTEAEHIQRLLENRKGFLAVTYNYTGYPMVRELKNMVDSGMLGAIQQIHIEMPQEGFARLTTDGNPMTPQSWRLHDGSIPTISLDLGVHLHMMVRFLTGQKPEELVAISASRGNFPEVADNVNCLVKYSNNIDCSIWYSKTAFGYRNGQRFRVFGDLGSAEWVQENPEYLSFADNSGGKYILDRTSNFSKVANQARYQRFKAGHPAGFIEAFANYYFDIAESLRSYLQDSKRQNHEFVFGVKESVEGLKMLEAISRSAVNKKWEVIK
ncbi:Gfo/Idh/MocA family oxidoreductase [Methylophilus medardicus]|uniref:Gfo/Idh/MocA family oxidoreductase n=1 Tax=Methylophilus medardicus TaxID=2588534 RepID=A0A5B8CSQ3_9PROT|nr:Gfo/Idh/MocA family oxidoreductase [Methylophilus medardicus]QDC49310.1 Gfo/Idh/MocA family oxidoreductase [Methylophilus medardicus]QDC53015.1 Gfo/Idh/MocA family oxidoreductase [Methylophilus medardicus]